MFRRGRKTWIPAVLAVALLLTASPGHASARPGHGGVRPGWERVWVWALDWLSPGSHGFAAPPAAREKSSMGIDPNGQPAPTSTTTPSTTQSDTSAGIDPNGGH